MLQVVLPNDANPMGFILGGSVMHLIDIAGAIAASRHARCQVVTAAVDGLQFLHPIKVGELILLRATVTATFNTSLEVEVEVCSENVVTGERRLTSVAFLTFTAVSEDGACAPIPPLRLDTERDRERAAAAVERRKARLAARDSARQSFSTDR